MADDSTLQLSVDTSGPACQVALAREGELVGGESKPMLRGHGEALVPMVEAVLASIGADYEALDRIGVCVGPGSYTGLRIALSAARGFGVALNVPVIGFNALEALAASDALETSERANRVAVLDARNGLVYAQSFDEVGEATTEPEVLADLVAAVSVPAEARVVGPAAQAVAELARQSGKSVTVGRNEPVASLEALAALTNQKVPNGRPAPLYLKPVDAALSASAGLRAEPAGASTGERHE